MFRQNVELVENWNLELARHSKTWRTKNIGLWGLFLGALVLVQWYKVAALCLAIKLNSQFSSAPYNLIDIEQSKKATRIILIQRLRTALRSIFPAENEGDIEIRLDSLSPKKQYPSTVESVYLSESGDELSVTMFPHGTESKHVYFMKMERTRFERDDSERGSANTQDVYIVDDHHDLQVILDLEFRPAKISQGLYMFTKGGPAERAEWIRHQIGY